LGARQIALIKKKAYNPNFIQSHYQPAVETVGNIEEEKRLQKPYPTVLTVGT
jgi:hypothetical protein